VNPLQSAEGPKDVNKVMARFGLSLTGDRRRSVEKRGANRPRWGKRLHW